MQKDNLVFMAGRTHENDVSGEIMLKNLSYEHLMIPIDNDKNSSLIKKRRMTEDDLKLSAKIRSLRRAREISQVELAKIVGVSFQQIQNYETGGNRVSFGALCSIAQALGVSIGYFAEE